MIENLRRLTHAGLSTWRTAEELRSLREHYPINDDLAPQLRSLEEEARGLAGEIAMRLLGTQESR